MRPVINSSSPATSKIGPTMKQAKPVSNVKNVSGAEKIDTEMAKISNPPAEISTAKPMRRRPRRIFSGGVSICHLSFIGVFVWASVVCAAAALDSAAKAWRSTPSSRAAWSTNRTSSSRNASGFAPAARVARAMSLKVPRSALRRAGSMRSPLWMSTWSSTAISRFGLPSSAPMARRRARSTPSIQAAITTARRAKTSAARNNRS